jgi:uncharacterized protein (TIGR01619 family)
MLAPLQLPEWDFYFCTVDEKPASIMLDLSLTPLAPVPQKPELIQVLVDLNDPNDFGLTNLGEAEILYVMEDRLAEHLSKSLGGLYVARNTTNEQRIFYFYCQSSVDFERVVEEVMEGFARHTYSTQTHHDPLWDFYREFLFPAPAEYQSILNRRVIEKLEQHGDDLSEAREVEHFVYFPTEVSLTKFQERVSAERFRVLSKGTRQDDPQYPYSLMIARMDRVDPASIDEVVLHLLQLTRECHGQYDGWSTGIVVK